MDPLSTAASVIAIATLAAQSCKMTYGLIDELVGAPQVMSNAKTLLSITQKTFDSLHENLEQTSDTPEGSGRLESVLRRIPLEDILQSAQGLCSEFSVVLKECTRHSTGGSFSTRDRLTVSLRESKIQRYNKLLGEYQQTVNAVVDSIILYLAKDTSRNVDQLADRFRTQEQALVDLSQQLRSTETSLQASTQTMALDRLEPEGTEASSDALGIQWTRQLRELCEETLTITKEGRTGQKFGQAVTQNGSRAFQGISGAAQANVEQSFGNLITTNNSKAAQGQLSSEAFAQLFG